MSETTEDLRPTRHQLAGYPAPWHSDWCGCAICTQLRQDESLRRIAASLERITQLLEERS